MMEIVIAFLGVSLLLYVLFGGADFGAGILEVFLGRKRKHIPAHAIGPVWEANHVWLIVAVVILFMGFPQVYASLSLYLHIPLLLLLIGIIMRGTAFVFRHYDAIKDQSERYYTLMFRVSSLLVPLLLGMITGAVMLGRITTLPSDFHTIFIAPWLNWFTLSVGVFTVCMFALLAAVYLAVENSMAEGRREFVRLARNLSFMTVGAGAGVFLAAEAYGLHLLTLFMESPVNIAALVLATASLPLLWYSLSAGKVVFSRMLTVFQVFLILGAWFHVQFPDVMRFADGSALTFANTAAPAATLRQLMLALLVGSCLIFPALYFLYKTFKFDTEPE